MVSVLVHALPAVVHGLVGAVWLGSMAFSLFILQPRARDYFGNESDLEAFFATVGHGARWKVLSALGVMAVTGIALAVVRWPHPESTWWFMLVGAKVVLFAAALGLFIHISWHLWPARLFASSQELPRLQRTFRRAGLTMVALAGLSTVLGILLHIG
jgi:uncharacterized membrane protein